MQYSAKILREVTVSARAVLVACVFFVSLTALADPPKLPSAEEIATAVRQLGDKRYAIREQATKRLWQAGVDAEAALQQALKSRDAEVARRARELLDKIEWGIFADTPDEVVALVNKYRAGDANAQNEAVRGLVKARRPGLTVLARIGHRVTPEAHPALAKAMTDAAREVVPQLLAARDYVAAGELLETCVTSGVDAALNDYAAFVVLQGQLDVAIARRLAETPPRPAVLAVLFRAKGDVSTARKYAQEAAAKDDGLLLDEILWEQGDWAELAKRPAPEGLQPAIHRGTSALLHRLAGNTKALDADLAELRQAIKANEKWVLPSRTPPAGEPAPPPDSNLLFLAWTAAKTLVLVEQPNPALSVLDSLPEFRPQLFALFAARLQYREALALADRPAAPGEAGMTTAIKQARLLYLLGDADRAGQVFAKVAERLKTADEVDTAVELCEVQMKLGLVDAAREHAARFIAELVRQTANEQIPRQVLGAVFPKRGEEAWVWWNFFRQKFPQDDATGMMKRVRALLDPPVGGNRPGPSEWSAALLAAQPAEDAHAKAMAHEALSATHEAAGQLDAARAELVRACENSKDPARWLRLGDSLIARKDYAAAADAYAKSAECDPLGPLAVYLHGRALEQAGRGAEGRQKIEQAYWQSLGNTVLRADVAADLAKRGHDDLAAHEREMILKLGWPRVWSEGGLLSALARGAAARKDYAVAADWYERLTARLLADAKDFAETGGLIGVPALMHAHRARAALMTGSLSVMQVEADRCLSLTPGNLEVALALVPELDRRGQKSDGDLLYKRVAGAYTRLCGEFPRSPLVHNAAAWLAAGCRRDLDVALEHARTAVTQAPTNAGFLDTLAEVNFQRGEQAKAIELMHKCLTLEPRNTYFANQLRRFEVGDRDAPVPPENDDD
jgi:tetratricopeptide (TPR) repeat protein